MRKSDPLQGILFNTKPVLLRKRATDRARTVSRKEKHHAFFDKLTIFKSEIPRISRRKRILLTDVVVQHKALGKIVMEKSKSIF